ncbi:MAG TPA: hypothetical protein VF897_13000 [Roseiflexaceae bacterium]
MTTPILQRQFITDAEGRPIGVILPLEEFALIERTLEQRLSDRSVDEKIALIEQAANDPLFLADLQETMDAFAAADAEWWEPLQ